jgi:hypothetical protein
MSNPTANRMTQWILSCFACLVTLIIAALIVRLGLRHVPDRAAPQSQPLTDLLTQLGAEVTITAAGKSIATRWPAVVIERNDGERIDPNLSAGGEEVYINYRFEKGRVEQAYLGAELQGGSLMILREGKVLLSTYAGERPITRLTQTPIGLGLATQELEFIFQRDGESAMRLRAVWKPIDADQISALPVSVFDPQSPVQQ